MVSLANQPQNLKGKKFGKSPEEDRIKSKKSAGVSMFTAADRYEYFWVLLKTNISKTIAHKNNKG